MVDDLFSKAKPQCVGGYIVDVPELFNNGTKMRHMMILK